MVKPTFFLFLMVIPLSLTVTRCAPRIDREQAREILTKENIAKQFISIVKKKGEPIKVEQRATPLKIAFATPLEQSSDYWRRSIQSFRRRMQELNININIYEFSTRAYEHRKLKQSVGAAMKINPDYIVVTLNDAIDEEIISRTLASNKVKVIVQNVTTPVESWKTYRPFMYVGFSHIEGTNILTNEFLRRFQRMENVEYAVLHYVKDGIVDEQRSQTLIKTLDRYPNFKRVEEYYTEGDRQKAYLATLAVLKAHPNVKFLYACATDVALGAVDALKEKGLLGKVVVNGWGGGAAELNSIRNNELSFTVMRMNDDNGVAMAEAIRLDLENQLSKIPQVFSGEMLLVSQGMKDEQLSAIRKQAFRYSGAGSKQFRQK